MRERTELLIRGMTENRTKRHRWMALVTALAFLTGGNVFWSLREIGTALTDEQLCTLEAHEHSEECYDENGELLCGKEEHVHTAACFSDENADVETEEIWEQTLPEREGLSRQEQVALIAESQLGYAESMNNFILGEDGTQHGYTRYGAWYGNPYGEWNTMFTYFCLYYAGVSVEEIPCGGNARTWQVKLTENELIRPPDSDPERGEIVLLDLDADGEADLTGIVTDTAETLHFVEGDLGHAVAEGELALDAEQILGYVAIPEPDTPDAENPEETPPDAEPAPAEEQPAASESESEQPLATYRAEAPSGIQVNAVAAEGVFPADTVMTVTDVPREEALQAAAEGLSAGAEALDAVAVDISFYAVDGTEIEPDGGVDVEITLPETQQLAGENYTLLHVADDGAVQTVEAEFADDAVTFTAERFSMYVVTSRGTQTEDVATAMNNVHLRSLKGSGSESPPIEGYFDSLYNSSDNRYPVNIGEVIEVSVIVPKGTNGYFAVNNNNDPNNRLRRTADGADSRSSYDAERDLITAKYYGSMTGDCSIQYKIDDTVTEEIFLKVQQPFYFHTPLGEIQKDRVHEYLERAAWDRSDNAFVICDENGNPLYVKNTESSQGRFFIPPQGEFTLVTYSTDASMQFSIADVSMLEKVEGTYDSKPIEMPTKDGNAPQLYRISQRFKAIGNGAKDAWDGNTNISLNDEKFYVHIHNIDTDTDKYHHSDIEIADGSYFYYEYTETLPDGSIKKQNVQYDAYVTEVEHCYLFDQNGNRVKNYLGTDLEYVTGDYESEGDVGTSQYEYTSQNRCSLDGKKDKWYDIKNVYGAEFEVIVSLKPRTLTETITNGEITTTTVHDIRNDPNYPDSTALQTYHLGYDAVIAAFNKCPNRNGLDFNIKETTYLAVAPIKATKDLEFDNSQGKAPLKGGEFEYELYRVEQNVLKVSNQSNAQISPGDIPVKNVFSDYQNGDIVKAYLFFAHESYGLYYNYNTASFDLESMNSAYPQYTQDYGFVNLIDNLNNGNPADNPADLTEEQFYDLLYQNVRPDTAIPSAGGSFDLNAGHFLFQKETKVASVRNDADGNIVFPNQVFMKPGIYHYYLREVVPEGSTAYEYDTAVHKVTVTVTADDSGSLSSVVSYDGDMIPPTFTNTLYTYTLPSTGGVGSLPYYLGGGILLAAAALLFEQKRREGR